MAMTKEVCCTHRWKPYADSKHIWTVCEKCGKEEDVATHDDQLLETIAYIFKDA